MNPDDGSNGLADRGGPAVEKQSRFERRWHLVGAGLSNVWRFGDLELPAASGRLLLRGPNGTGKTTALEALAPYLLDLNAVRMSAGKARTTNLSSLMREGASGKRRYGYAWLTLAEPKGATWSCGVRIQYSEGASPPSKVIPFSIPGRPLHELKLHGVARALLTIEQFAEAVAACGGQLFETEDAYVSHLAARLFGTPTRDDVATLASRLRDVRNPTLLGDVSPQAAADALRESLPGVADEVINATAEALAESDATRDAFTRDKEAAELLAEFRTVWCAHAAEVVGTAQAAAAKAAQELKSQLGKVRSRLSDVQRTSTQASQAKQHVEVLEADIASTRSEVDALREHEAYRNAGRLADLRRTAAAQLQTAGSTAELMRTTAQAVRMEADSVRRELENIAEDLRECSEQARAADASTEDPTSLLAWTLRSRPPLRAGDIVAEPGPELVIEGTPDAMRGAANAWLRFASRHSERADAASLAIIDHREVEACQLASNDKKRVARDAAATADAKSADAKRAELSAQTAALDLIATMRSWTDGHPALAEPLAVPETDAMTEASGLSGWSIHDFEQLAEAEPRQVLVTCDGWARHAIAQAERIAGERRSEARRATADAESLRGRARALRDEAAELRSGRLLPLPRPEWAGPGDDSLALGVVLDWQLGFDDATERALLEAAMAASGLLSASVGEAGTSTRYWRVDPVGPVVAEQLSRLVAVDLDHPLAPTVTAVLERVRVASTIPSGAEEASSGLCLGRDGTFCAGVLRGRVPGADDPAALAPARHVGARQRRAAALARADLLEGQAAELEFESAKLDDAAARLEREAEAASALGRMLPSREELRDAESRRTALSRIAREAQDAAVTAEAEADLSARALEIARGEWLERTRARGLPGELEELKLLRDRGKETAEKLRKAARPLGEKLPERLDRVVAGYSAVDAERRLVLAEATAQEAFRLASGTQTEVRVLAETAGHEIEQILVRHADAGERLSRLHLQHEPARTSQVQTAAAQAAAQASLDDAERRLREEVRPKAEQELDALRAMVGVPGVADAVLDGALPPGGDALIGFVEDKLRGRRTLTLKTALERADITKAKLAGVWSLDPGDSNGGLLSFVLSYRDGTYTPIEAANHAETLKSRAEQALANSEERALREFVIGRLPSAIGTAWTRLQDWRVDVNRKMKSAAASSGVGVQVCMPLREDLAPATRDVYELSCKVSTAERTLEQQRRLADALQALLAAAQGETMSQRVASAVDIREWVDVYYEVTRPGGMKQRWSSRTGLSGGERRLVVLGPMLAAIAAGYDRFGSKALRVVTLDEVPAEVDERGREGLARYIAELDLDLICTSYLWDGCPGAWDGVDAHDLEAGPDGTVVAFPMLVRGLSPIPENTSELPAPTQEPLD